MLTVNRIDSIYLSEWTAAESILLIDIGLRCTLPTMKQIENQPDREFQCIEFKSLNNFVGKKKLNCLFLLFELLKIFVYCYYWTFFALPLFYQVSSFAAYFQKTCLTYYIVLSDTNLSFFIELWFVYNFKIIGISLPQILLFLMSLNCCCYI